MNTKKSETGTGSVMSKRSAAAGAPAAPAAALACGNAACGKALAPPLLQCSKCKAEAYCCKAARWETGRPPPAARSYRPGAVCASIARI